MDYKATGREAPLFSPFHVESRALYCVHRWFVLPDVSQALARAREAETVFIHPKTLCDVEDACGVA